MGLLETRKPQETAWTGAMRTCERWEAAGLPLTHLRPSYLSSKNELWNRAQNYDKCEYWLCGILLEKQSCLAMLCHAEAGMPYNHISQFKVSLVFREQNEWQSQQIHYYFLPEGTPRASQKRTRYLHFKCSEHKFYRVWVFSSGFMSIQRERPPYLYAIYIFKAKDVQVLHQFYEYKC